MGTSADLKSRLRPYLLGLFLWVLLIAVTSTSRAPAGVHRSWAEGLVRSTISWTVWAALSPLIIKVDRILPVARASLLKRFAFHIPLGVAFTAIKQFLSALAISFLIVSGTPQVVDFRSSLRGTFQSNLQGYWIILLIYVAFEYQTSLREGELRNIELRRLAAESRLAALRAQLHPHFLFNALNTISAHVERAPRTARRMLGELGELLRLSLVHADDQLVPLAQEIAFVEHYLEIQKARFEERLVASVNAEGDVLDALVPTFILQPLVENAILYGTSQRIDKSSVLVNAWRKDGDLHLTVQDDGPGLPDGWDGGTVLGIGISNTRQRLRFLYGERDQTFNISSEPGQGVRVDLRIPFQKA